MLVPPLISKYGGTLLALESRVIKHVLDHVDNSNLFKFVPAMRTKPIAAAFPLVDATLACEHLALTTADHILHHISADRTNKLVNLLPMLLNHIVRSESLGVIANFVFDYALNLCTYVGDKFGCAVLGFSCSLCNRRYAYPRL